jgi:Uma2 family endonuclease
MSATPNDALPRPHRLSLEEYHRMIEAGVFVDTPRMELIEGEIIEMTPIGPRHSYFVQRLNPLFLRRLPRDVQIRIQSPITLGDGSEPEPDIALVRDRDYGHEHPGPEDVLLVVEVADSSLAYDRGRKAALYARFGISEYWLIDTGEPALEIHRDPAPEGYREVTRPRMDDEVAPVRLADCRLRVADLLLKAQLSGAQGSES